MKVYNSSVHSHLRPQKSIIYLCICIWDLKQEYKRELSAGVDTSLEFFVVFCYRVANPAA